ncbi:SAV_2336 N-terminal domain-related protein [Streptomyces cacaoi]|uniref:SAV_2336 N-terminal domain-related protein n=1 Tax=Streptomyces cacaoi TaxID=1898 RepID=UPI003318E928
MPTEASEGGGSGAPRLPGSPGPPDRPPGPADGGSAPGTGPGGPGPVAELAARLAALPGRREEGADGGPSARELAELLWLARHVPPAGGGTPAPPGDDTAADGPAPPPPGGRPKPPADEPETEPGGRRETAEPEPATAGLRSGRPVPPQRGRTPETGDGPRLRAVPVRAPAATVLPGVPELQRALRPLQGYQPPVGTRDGQLDEQATAERAAETGLVVPVLRGATTAGTRIRLVMDVSSSTVLWQGALAELAQVCAVTGAFREVRTYHLREGRDGTVLASPDHAGRRMPCPAERLRDPTGQQLTLVLSDCAGPLWRAGRMQRLLHHWASGAPVALVQPLPQRLWRRTHLPAEPGVLRRREGRGARLAFTGGPTARAAPGARALPVPVLALNRDALGTWARLLSGSTGLSQPGAVGWVRPDHPSAGPRPARPTGDRRAAELLRAFRTTASREALRLAVCLSAAPLTLPVMQLVQRTMLPSTGPEVLAEVVLSGLLHRAEGEPGAAEDAYAFAPGVRRTLLRSLPKGEAVLVLKHVSAYVERHFGRRSRNFPAYALARLTGTEPPDAGAPADPADLPPAFAEVPAAVVRRFGGEPEPVEPAERPAPGTLPGVERVDPADRAESAGRTDTAAGSADGADGAESAGRSGVAGPGARGREAQEVRRAVVRVVPEGGGPWVNGFFLAPGWVVTVPAAGAAEDRVTVETATGQRFTAVRTTDRTAPAWQRPLAFVQVPEAAAPDCLWLADQQADEDAAVLVQGWAPGSPSRGPEFTTVAGGPDGPRPRERTEPRPGAPVRDAATGEVVGVHVPVPGAARRRRRPVWAGAPDGGRLPWRALVRAHDLHHWRRLSSGGHSWPRQAQRNAPEDTGFGPVRRAYLYGILARLEPPASASTVLELVSGVVGPYGYAVPGPLGWRDGVAMVRAATAEPGVADVLRYAVRVWAAYGPGGPRRPWEALHAWAESVAASLPEGPVREEVLRTLEDPPPAAQYGGVAVHLDPVAGPSGVRYDWSVELEHGERSTLIETGHGPDTAEGLPGELSGPLSFALDLGDVGQGVAGVRFALPPELFDLPVDAWRVGTGPPLGATRHITVMARGRRRHPRRRDRWEGIHREQASGLEPVPLLLGEDAGDIHHRLNSCPDNTVPVHCGPVSHRSDPQAAQAVAAALRAGYGLLLWRRDEGEHEGCEEFQQRAFECVRRAGDAEGLLDLVHALRRAQQREDGPATRWVRDLAVLYDPPDAPADDSWPLPAPRLRRRGAPGG